MIKQVFRFLLYMEGHLDLTETLVGHGLRKVEIHWSRHWRKRRDEPRGSQAEATLHPTAYGGEDEWLAVTGGHFIMEDETCLCGRNGARTSRKWNDAGYINASRHDDG